MAELTKVAGIMFRKGSDWSSITDTDKEECWFIFNRYFSKTYPSKALLLNDKNIDKIYAMNIWFAFIQSQPYQKNFWSKATNKKEKDIIIEKDINMLLTKLDIKLDELNILLNNYPDLIKEELKYYKDLEKNK